MQELGVKRKRTIWEREPASDDIIIGASCSGKRVLTPTSDCHGFNKRLRSSLIFLAPCDMDYIHNLASKRPKYREYGSNLHLDLPTKIALLKTSPSVAMRRSFRAGTIIESNHDGSIVLTSANLISRPTREELENILVDNLKVIVHTCHGNSYKGEDCAHDFHFNLAAIRIKPESSLVTATLARVDDSVSITSIQPSFQLRAHSRSFNLVPGAKVIALARYFAKPFDIMAAHGEYCLERSDSEYGANCIITRCGDGGPLVNYNGEVIGITYYDFGLMPINIVCKWWEHYKRFGEYCRPDLGIEATNLYAANECIIERIMLKFPSICKGVFMEKVVLGSSADLAGIHVDDVIVQCDGKSVQSFLEFFETIWDKVGELVELIVLRPDNVTQVHLNMHVEVTSDRLNRWPRRNYK